MKQLLLVFILAISILGCTQLPTRDATLRDSIVLLHSDRGTCTGVVVQTPSRKNYILTAGHCWEIMDSRFVWAQDENGSDVLVRWVANSPDSDLMLLETDGSDPVRIATTWHKHEHVHTLTHGRGMPTYRTDGELLTIASAVIPEFVIDSPAKLLLCSLYQKYEITPNESGGVVCSLHIAELYSTAATLPGSSGGPVFNSKGELVAIVSASNGEFQLFVPLADIVSFLADK